MLLGTPRGCSGIPEVSWACSHDGWLLGPAPIEVTDLGLVWQMWLAWACSEECHWLRPTPEEVAGLSLVPQRLLSCTCSRRGRAGSGPVPQRWLAPWYLLQWRSLAQAWYHGCSWLRYTCTEVTGLELVPWRLLAWPAPIEVFHLVLLLWRSLAVAQFHRSCWFKPTSSEVGPSYLFLLQWRLLARSWSRKCPWLRLAPMEVVGLGLGRSLARACSGRGRWLEPVSVGVPV